MILPWNLPWRLFSRQFIGHPVTSSSKPSRMTESARSNSIANSDPEVLERLPASAGCRYCARSALRLSNSRIEYQAALPTDWRESANGADIGRRIAFCDPAAPCQSSINMAPTFPLIQFIATAGTNNVTSPSALSPHARMAIS